MIPLFSKQTDSLIQRRPDVLGGKPIVKGTRISVEFILELLASGMTPEAVTLEYTLPKQAVSDALTFASDEMKREDVVDLERS